MDLVQLERFVAVASAGSMRKAAKRLGVSQPTLTWSIHHLEASVGGALLERHGRGSRLTEAGEVLLPHAQLLINEGRRARLAIESLQEARDPEISIGSTPPFASDLIPAAIDRVLRATPRLRVLLVQADSPSVVDGVRNAELDVAFVNPRADLDLSGIDFEPIYEERYALAARADHPIFGRCDPVSLEAVTQYGWAAHRNAMTRDPRDTPFGHAGLPSPVIRTLVTSEHLLRPLILSTDLLGYVALDIIRRDLREGSIRIIDLPGITASTPAGLLVRHGANYTAAMHAFCREVRLLCKQRDPRPG
jgi:LysR family transcriptional regulator, regulator of abg operon